jgi:LCP family protein required for cell wall assembly
VSEEQLQSEARHRGRGLKRHSALRVLLACSVAVALVIGLGSVFFYRHLNENITFLDINDKLGDRPAKIAPGDPINVLIMGSDSRAGDQGVDQMENGGARSDTTILMHLSSDRKFAYGVSLPRDAIVDRPECKTDNGDVPAENDVMFNTAFYYGGVACTVKTVESLTGIQIDHWVVVNFNGFKDMVDAIGGVEVCVPHAIDDERYQMHLQAGTQKIKGQAALDYVRVRHGFGDGSDIGRMKRQQAFIASMAAGVVSAGTLTRVDRLVKFLDAATKSLALDTGVGNVLSLARLGNQFRTIGLDNIQFITVPWEWYQPDPNRIVWNTKLSNRLWDKIRHDNPLTRRLSADAITAEQESSPGSSPSSSASASPSGTASPSGSSSPSKSASSAQAAAEAEANGLCA